MIARSHVNSIREKRQIIIIIFYFYFTWALNVAGLILCFPPASTSKPCQYRKAIPKKRKPCLFQRVLLHRQLHRPLHFSVLLFTLPGKHLLRQFLS